MRFTQIARVLTITLLLAFLAPILSAQNVPSTQPVVSDRLTAHMPADTLVYAALSLSDDALAAYDQVVADILAGIPGVPSVPSVESLLDTVLQDEFDTDFASLTWLGDDIAVGITVSSRREYFTSDVVLAVEITDPAGAADFLTQLIGDFGSAAEARGDTTIYRIDDEGGAIITPDTMVLASNFDDLGLTPRAPTLDVEPRFLSVREQLTDAYPALVYMDTPRFYAIQMADTGRYRDAMNQAPFITAVMQIVGPSMYGFTRQGDALIMDVAVGAGNLTLPRLLNIPLDPSPATDPAALALAPSGAFAVVHGSGLLNNALALWEAYGPWVKDALSQQAFGRLLYDRGAESAVIASIIGRLEADQLANLGLSGLLGVTIDDLRNWTAGDYIMFLMVNPEWNPRGPAIELPVEGAAIFEVDDPQQSLDALERLARALTLLRDSTRSWHYADVEVLRAEDATELAVTIRPDGESEEAFHVSLIVSGDIVILGTQRAARTALADTFTRDVDPDPWLTNIQALTFEGGQNLYLQPSQLVPYIAAWTGRADEESEIIRTILAKLDTLLISSVGNPDGSAVGRFVIDLADTGDMETTMFRPTLAPAGRPTLPPPPTLFAVPTLDPVILTVTAIAETRVPQMMTPTPTPFDLPTPVALQVQPVVTDALGYDTGSFRGPDGAFTLGYPGAPVTLVVFADWACPHCQNFEPTVQRFIAEQVIMGRANLEHRTLPTAGGQTTVAVGKVAACAEELMPGSFWEVSRQLYDLAVNSRDSYSSLGATNLVVELLGIDRSAIQQCIGRSGQVEVDRGYASEIGVNSTPYVYVRYANGTSAQVTDRTIEGLTALVNAPQIVEPEDTPELTHDPSAAADIMATAAAVPLPTSAPADLSEFVTIDFPGSLVGSVRSGLPVTIALTVPEGVADIVITAASDDFDTTLELTTVGGVSLAYNDDDNFSINTNSKIEAVLPASTRQFLIVVAPFGESGSGEFTLTVSEG